MKPHLRWIAPLWILLLLLGSLLPDPKVAFGISLGQSPLKHRLAHFLFFGIAALLLLLLAKSHRQRLLAVAAVLAISLTVEYIQAVGYSNPFEWWDLRDDTLATLLVYFLFHRSAKTPSPTT